MRRLLLLPAAALMLAIAATVPVKGQTSEDNKDNILADELRLKGAYQATDGESLIAFLSSRAKGEVEPKELNGLIEKLDAKDAADRQKACQRLVAIGAPAIPKLRLTARDPDVGDTAALAKKLLAVIEGDQANVTGAAVRLLAARRPKGTAEALLAYLPHADSENVLEDIRTALAGVAYDKGKANPSMLEALADKHPLRRANAITALCAGGNIAEHRGTLRKLLIDKSPSVRLRAAMALSNAHDAKAISTLIALIADLSAEQGQEIETFLTELAGEQAPKTAIGTDEVSRQKARDAWAEWWLKSDGDALVKELSKRTLTEELMSKANNLIEKLGDDAFDERQKAEAELKKMGPMIMPLLKAALKNPDLEIRNRSQKILAVFENNPNTPLSMVVPRLIAVRKPKGAVEAILAYLPFAEDEVLIDELQVALNAVAFPGGKANPALLKALDDKLSIRRGAAAAALCSGPLEGNMKAIQALLKDKDNSVKLRVALALASAREKTAIPALINVISEGNSDQINAAEDYLFRLARENPPKDLPEGEDKKQARATAWEKWWDDNKEKTPLIDKYSEVRKPYQGLITLISQNNGMISELGRDHKERFKMTGMSSPWDAQWLNNNKLLVTEYNAMRVTERDKTGKILWEKKLNFYPIQAERLRNGNTFIVGQNYIIEYNRQGKEVFKYDRNNFHDIRNGRRLPNGQIVIIDQNNQMITFDKSGTKQLKKAQLQNVYNWQNEILDNGHVIVPLMYNNKVVEYSGDGKQVWEATVTQPVHAVRLPNKHTLVASQQQGKITELDAKGKSVREFQTNQYLFRIKAR